MWSIMINISMGLSLENKNSPHSLSPMTQKIQGESRNFKDDKSELESQVKQ